MKGNLSPLVAGGGEDAEPVQEKSFYRFLFNTENPVYESVDFGADSPVIVVVGSAAKMNAEGGTFQRDYSVVIAFFLVDLAM